MKSIKVFVLLLVMIAAGTIGFIGCSKKDIAAVPVQKEYNVLLTNSEKQWLNEYAYSDVIYVLKPKSKFDCTDVRMPDGSWVYTCAIPYGHTCRVLSAICGHPISDIRSLYLNNCY